MSTVPPITPPPPPKFLGMTLTADAHAVLRKWSTWLAILSASATAGLAAYAILPARVQGLMPDWSLGTLGAVAIITALLIPVATSVQQASLKR